MVKRPGLPLQAVRERSCWAEAQTRAGAHYLDLNSGTFADEEAEKLQWMIETVQEVTALPLCLDSPNTPC